MSIRWKEGVAISCGGEAVSEVKCLWRERSGVWFGHIEPESLEGTEGALMHRQLITQV